MKENHETGKRFVDLEEIVTATYFDDMHEEWDVRSVRIADVLDSVVDDYTILKMPVQKQKTGHWISVSGYATPGGDPVWECSECGKGRHVYGIEASTYQSGISDTQWVACPNCGAKMVEENVDKK